MYTKKTYVHENAAINLSKIYFLKNAKRTRKPNNHDLNRDWKIDDKYDINRLSSRHGVDTNIRNTKSVSPQWLLCVLPLFIRGNLGTSKIDCGDKIKKKPCLFTLSCEN